MTTATASLLRLASEAADSILRDVYNVRVSKALDPMDPGDFDTIVGRLASALRGAVQGHEREALHAALGGLDIDWPNTTAAQRGRIIDAAAHAIRQPAFVVIPRVDRAFRVRGDFIAGRSRRSMIARIETGISAAFHQRDEQIARWIRISQAAFVTDEYGRRAERVSELARSIVAQALDDGLGSDEITELLRSQLGSMLARRSDSYWSVIASSFAGRARAFGALSALNDAQIEAWLFVAMLDEVTCDACRLLDGMIFSVAGSYGRMASASRLTSPDQIRDAMPWIRHGRNAAGERILFVRRSDGSDDEVIATVERSGVGNRDDRGEFSTIASSARLEEIGCNMPPLHGRCRCEVVAQDSA